jgi:hypothetical protein
VSRDGAASKKVGSNTRRDTHTNVDGSNSIVEHSKQFSAPRKPDRPVPLRQVEREGPTGIRQYLDKQSSILALRRRQRFQWAMVPGLWKEIEGKRLEMHPRGAFAGKARKAAERSASLPPPARCPYGPCRIHAGSDAQLNAREGPHNLRGSRGGLKLTLAVLARAWRTSSTRRPRPSCHRPERPPSRPRRICGPSLGACTIGGRPVEPA